MLTSNEIRQQFIDFFCKKHGHTFVPSSSVVPLEDPTLLFANAGMNQFKDVFLGTGTRPYKRAANTQKCIRAGGKHNDLDDVGKDTYHHTFFEMLGNWSFGDYFKKEAITWAWELLTQVWGLDPTRLHATVFEGSPTEGVPRDDEAHALWKTLTTINPQQIHWGNKKDNFWEMGESGPCGPCTEIHIDLTPDKSGGPLVNKGTPQVIEIWNLVFIQFNRNPDRSLTPLPARHVDTGMGFERVTAVLQGKTSNYDTDVFAPLMAAIGQLSGKTYTGILDDIKDIAFRVIADHVRMASFAICDGARPGNKKRDAVLRSVIRRAVRYGYQVFELREPFVYKLVSVLVDQMGQAFPELKKNSKVVEEVLRKEEADFLTTIQRGLKHFGDAATMALRGGQVISGKVAADLQTTHGFPIDLTRQMAGELKLAVDEASYEEEMERHRGISNQGQKKMVITAIQGELPGTDDSPKYSGLKSSARVLGWVKDNVVVTRGELPEEQDVGLLLDSTCFYAEQGGQVGDSGVIHGPTGVFEVDTTQKLGDAVLHLGRVRSGMMVPGQTVHLEVGGLRQHTMRNHTATHLLNWALRRVLGDHVEQRGSLVDSEKARFDFTQDKPLTTQEIAEVERLVNEKIYADLPVTAVQMPLAEAKKLPGVRAVFGEKYPDPVRVLLIGTQKPAEASLETSVEFCGGTHLHHTGEAGFFKIISQELVSKGIRRLTAVTGREAVATVQRMGRLVDEAVGRFNCRLDELPARIESLQEEIKKLQSQIKKGSGGDLSSIVDRLLEKATTLGTTKVVVGEIPAASVDQIRSQVDRVRNIVGSSAILLAWVEEGKVSMLAAVTEDLIQKGLKAGDLVRDVARVVDGKGGGRPDMAQAGGSNPARLPEALDTARKWLTERLS